MNIQFTFRYEDKKDDVELSKEVIGNGKSLVIMQLMLMKNKCSLTYMK